MLEALRPLEMKKKKERKKKGREEERRGEKEGRKVEREGGRERASGRGWEEERKEGRKETNHYFKNILSESFTYSFMRYTLIACCVPGAILNTVYREVIETNNTELLLPMKFSI